MKKVWVTGHRGMVGSAICNAFREKFGDAVQILTRTRTELDVTNTAAVEDYIASEKPDTIVNAAAKVGGIHANNTYPAEFLQENLAINLNLVHSAWRNGVERFLNLGSSCIYPKMAPQPIKEDSLLTSPLESTNEAYALAKITGLKLCQFYRRQYGVLYHSAMPCNLYGPGDNYHGENSHVIPALLRKFHEAKENKAPEVIMWGTGTPLREFLHTEDLADGVLHLLTLENPPNWVNIGFGSDVTIRELAEKIKATVGYEGKINNDTSKPDGTPRKLMDNALIRSTGWEPKIGLDEGLKGAYQDFLDSIEAGTARL
ncbi:MAG: GDP-L-fucose synthase [Opitutales bacterium]|nr:GDP-L-fucose synthase [Opitutales bacterium]